MEFFGIDISTTDDNGMTYWHYADSAKAA